jgi:hypothetical protein
MEQVKKSEIPKRAGTTNKSVSTGIKVFCTKDKFKFGDKLISDNFYVSVPE